MESFLHDEVGALWISLDDKFVAAQVARHVERVYRCAQILTNFVFLRIESYSFADTLETAFTPDVEHHLEAHHVTVLLNYSLSLVISI